MKNSPQGEKLEAICRELLLFLGENPEREGLRETPKRWARWWEEFKGYKAGRLDAVFEHFETDQMVVVSGIRIWTLCEHHLLPFWCTVSMGYVTEKRVLGLSKFARIAHEKAHKLQIQERLTQEIADEIQNLIQSPNVAVVTRGEHLCMVMRGIKSSGEMTTSVMRGVFREKDSARHEFLMLSGLL